MLPWILFGLTFAVGEATATPSGARAPGANVAAEEVVRIPEEAPSPGVSAALASPERLPGNPDLVGTAVAPRSTQQTPSPSGLVQAAYQEAQPGPAPGAGPAGQAGAEQKPAGGPTEPKRRAMPSPFDSPPFPGSEYQGYPIIGVPPDNTIWPLMKAIQGTPYGDVLNANKTRVYGWLTAEGNWSTSKNSNTPDSYWIRPNKLDMDQAVIRFERQLDSVQTDHIDYGFRATLDYGIDYRYFTAGGWFSNQLLEHNLLYGWDPTELYVDVYVPWVTQGLIVRVGSRMVDSSLKSKLQRLKLAMKGVG